MEAPVLQLENITKIYPNGFVANERVNMSVARGEIHALVGENGAGKSTLMKVLFGIETHEEGRILLNGAETRIESPEHAIRLGIGMVHQHFMLVPSLSVAENLIIGIEPRDRFGLIDIEKSHRDIETLAAKFNFRIDPRQKVRDLTVGQKQKVEIIKTLIRGATTIILDEPTAVLTPQETDELFAQLRSMKAEGFTVIFISHKLEEVTSLCDSFTVLRRGRSIHSGTMAGVTEKDISRLMVGRDVVLEISKEPARPGRPVLQVRDLVKIDRDGKHVVNKVSFTVREGEILGIAGVEGNGQTELSESITGMEGFARGDLALNGKSLAGSAIRDIRLAGLAHISEDRMTYGCSQNQSVWENVISDRYFTPGLGSRFSLRFREIFRMAEDYRKRFTIKCDSIRDPVKSLSGGNIQKVVVAREFTSPGNFIVANQPTRGIDVGATEFIRNELVRLTRENNKAVLLISADLNEVLELADSLLVMVNGEIVAYFADTAAVDEYELGKYMLGLERQSPEEIRRAVHE